MLQFYCMNDKGVEAKIDDLARMVADGFTEVHSEIKELRDTMPTQDDLAELKNEIGELRQETVTKADLERLRGDLDIMLDIMLDKHMGIFRKDFDELAARVKRPEMAIFK